MIRFFTTSFLLAFCIAINAQTVTITGQVIDNDTEEGVPFCNVYFEGTTIGTSSDVDGYYTLTTATPGDSLSVSAVGYRTMSKVMANGAEIKINFRLSSSDLTLTEVVVYAGENPADEVVRNIIKNKKRNRIDKLDAYQCEAYTKLELDLDNINEKLRNSKLMKPFAFIFENIDSTSDEKPFLPAYITETIEDIYYTRKDKRPRKVPKAQRVSGVTNQTVVEFLATMHEYFSVYDNWIPILEKNFASPFSNQGLSYYEYYIIDSAFIEDQWSYKLKFKPKRKQENTFYGDFWVADSIFAVQRLNMRMSEGANINLVQRTVIYQEFGLHDNTYWLPTKQKMMIDFVTTKKAPGLIGRKTVSYKDYKVNKEEIANSFKQVDPDAIYLMNELERDESFWEEARHDKLSKNEAAIYAMVDSIKNVPAYKTYVDIIYTLVVGFKEFGPIEVGPYFTALSANPVEGTRIQMGVWTSNQFSKRIRFGGYAAYGFRDKRVKYGGDVQLNLSKNPRIVLGAAYKNDVAFNTGNSEEIGEGNLFSGFYRRPIIQKLIDTREAKFFYERYWKRGWSNRLTFLHQRLDPFGNIQEGGGGFNYAYLPDPESLSNIDTTITTTELIFKTRFAYDEKFIDGEFSRTSLGTQHPIIEFQYNAGLKGVMGGEYSYHKITLGYRHFVYTNPMGWLSYKIKAGKVFGTVPFLLAEVHNGNETYFYGNNVFNGMNRFEFASDTYAMLILTHHMDGFIFNKIPLLRKLKWRAVSTFKAVAGYMSKKNQERNRLNDFPLPGEDTYTGYRTPSGVPYMEAGAGIENIFKILRFDAVWRLTYLDNPEAVPFSVRGSIDFNF
ncbi:MAG: DUF5686 family protein [Bacteroidota bacterium]